MKTFKMIYKVLIPLCTVIALLPLLIGCSKTEYSIQKPLPEKAKGECVVLLHGMGRTFHSMDDMQTALTRAGYYTVNLNYPSTKKTIEIIASENLPPAIEQCRKFKPAEIHFVTHSLGGIIVRMAIKKNRPELLGKVVMLSPPNQGSEVTDRLKDWWFYTWLNGPAGQQLTTNSDSIPNQLGPVDYPVGIITGDRYAFFDSWFASILPGRDDGKVSVKRARLEGMSDFLVVHQSHPFIMDADYVLTETLNFLNNGTFKHQKDPMSPASGSDWFSLPTQ